jgi:hypothetical protein
LNFARVAAASPPWPSTASRSVVYCPSWKYGGSFAAPYSLRVMNRQFPAKNPGEPAGWFVGEAVGH